MKRAYLVGLLAAFIDLTSASCQSAEPPPLHDAHLDFDKLKSWGDRTYRMTFRDSKVEGAQEQVVGQMTFGCKVGDGSTTLTNLTRLYLPDGKRYIEYRAESVHPEMDLFATRRFTWNASRSDGILLTSLSGTIDADKLALLTEEGGSKSTVESPWAKHSLPDVSVFFIVTLLPRKTGQLYKIANCVSIRSPPESRPYILEGGGPDKESGKPEKPWTLFLRYEPNDRAKAVRFWVDDESVLQRV